MGSFSKGERVAYTSRVTRVDPITCERVLTGERIVHVGTVVREHEVGPGVANCTVEVEYDGRGRGWTDPRVLTRVAP